MYDKNIKYVLLINYLPHIKNNDINDLPTSMEFPYLVDDGEYRSISRDS